VTFTFVSNGIGKYGNKRGHFVAKKIKRIVSIRPSLVFLTSWLFCPSNFASLCADILLQKLNGSCGVQSISGILNLHFKSFKCLPANTIKKMRWFL